MANPFSADSFVGVPPDGAGKLIDTSAVTTTDGLVQRERDNIADPSDPVAIANVRQDSTYTSDYGVVVRLADTGSDGPFSDTFYKMLQELRSIRILLTHLATQDGSASSVDFEPNNFTDDRI